MKIEISQSELLRLLRIHVTKKGHDVTIFNLQKSKIIGQFVLGAPREIYLKILKDVGLNFNDYIFHAEKSYEWNCQIIKKKISGTYWTSYLQQTKMGTLSLKNLKVNYEF